jgi:hypothetical protein
MIRPETEYLMLRAQDEAVRAIQAPHPAAAAAHQHIALAYSERAISALAGAPAPRPVKTP